MKRLWLTTLVALLALCGAQELSLADQVALLQQQFQETAERPLVILWVMVGVLFTLIFQTPYLLLELSMPASPDHVLHPLVRNVLLCGQVSIFWYCLGWALAYGDGNPFLGTTNFFLTTNGSFPGSQQWSYAHFALGWAIVCLIGAITSCVMSTRVTFRTHFFTWVLISFWIQAIPAHWIWSHTGWLAPNSTTWHIGHNGFLDWGGAAPIHCVAACTALVATLYLGPRVAGLGPNALSETKVAQENQNKDYLWVAHFITFVCLFCINSVPGLFCLVDADQADRWVAVPRAMALTLIGGFNGPWILWVWTWWWNRRKIPAPYTLSPRMLMNSILVSMISISGGGAFVEAWAAIPIAFVGFAFFYGMTWTLERLGIDDPHDLIALHGAGGLWGCVATGVFTTQANLQQALGLQTRRYGWIMLGGLEQLAIQCLGAAATVLWVLVNTAALFWVLRWWQILRPGGKVGNRWRSRRRSSAAGREPLRSEASTPPPMSLVPGAADASALPPINFSGYHEHQGSMSVAPHDQLPAPVSVDSTVQRSGGAVPQYMSGFIQYDDPPAGQIPDGGWSYN